jgi:hypothetical protein
VQISDVANNTMASAEETAIASEHLFTMIRAATMLKQFGAV